MLLSWLAHGATPMAGLELTPFSRADLAWVESGRVTDSVVGEFDGTVWPGLRAFAGAWFGEHLGWTGALGVARLSTTTAADDLRRYRHRGVFRPSTDLRISLFRRDDERPRPLLLVGIYGDIPSAGESGEGLTEAERESARQDAALERARLGGVGARLGAGVDLDLRPNLAVGFLWYGRLHRATAVVSEATTATVWVGTEAAVTVTVAWPRREPAAQPAPGSTDPETPAPPSGSGAPGESNGSAVFEPKPTSRGSILGLRVVPSESPGSEVVTLDPIR